MKYVNMVYLGYNFINPFLKVQLAKICWYKKDNPFYNCKVEERIHRSLMLKGKPKRYLSTPGSDNYEVQIKKGTVFLEVILGKKEVNAHCACEDFQKHLEIAEQRGSESVMPCKHIIRVMGYRRATRR